MAQAEGWRGVREGAARRAAVLGLQSSHSSDLCVSRSCAGSSQSGLIGVCLHPAPPCPLVCCALLFTPPDDESASQPPSSPLSRPPACPLPARSITFFFVSGLPVSILRLHSRPNRHCAQSTIFSTKPKGRDEIRSDEHSADLAPHQLRSREYINGPRAAHAPIYRRPSFS